MTEQAVPGPEVTLTACQAPAGEQGTVIGHREPTH